MGDKQWTLWNGKRYKLTVTVMRTRGPRTKSQSVTGRILMMPSVSASTVIMIDAVTGTTGSYSEKRIDTVTVRL